MRLFVLILASLLAVTNCNKIGARETLTPDNSRMDSSWFSVQLRTCDKQNKLGAPDELWRYGTYFPYDTLPIIRNDSLVISFKFVADCCLTFSGRAEAIQDTLFLKYGLDRTYNQSCGCWCEYALTYRMDKGGRKWSAVKIVYKKDDIFKSFPNE